VEQARARLAPERRREQERMRLAVPGEHLGKPRRVPPDVERRRGGGPGEQERRGAEAQRGPAGAGQGVIGSERGGEGEEKRGRRGQLLGETEQGREGNQGEQGPVDAERGPGGGEGEDDPSGKEQRAAPAHESTCRGEQERRRPD